MKDIKLNYEQRQKIYAALEGLGLGGAVKENFCEVITINEDLWIEAEGYLAICGYDDDNYFTGTGNFIETGRECSVTLTPYYGEDENEVVTLDPSLKELAEQFLLTGERA